MCWKTLTSVTLSLSGLHHKAVCGEQNSSVTNKLCLSFTFQSSMLAVACLSLSAIVWIPMSTEPLSTEPRMTVSEWCITHLPHFLASDRMCFLTWEMKCQMQIQSCDGSATSRVVLNWELTLSVPFYNLLCVWWNFTAVQIRIDGSIYFQDPQINSNIILPTVSVQFSKASLCSCHSSIVIHRASALCV